MSNDETTDLGGAGVVPRRIEPHPGGLIATWAMVSLVLAFVTTSTNLVAVSMFAEFYDARRVLQIALFVGLAGLLAVSRSLRFGVLRLGASLPWPFRVSAAGIAVIGVASAVRAPLPQAGLREVALLSLIVLLTIAIAAVRIRLQDRFDLAVVATLVAAILAYAVFFVVLRRAHISLFGFESLGTRPWQHLYGWTNARFFGQAAVWLFPLLVAAPAVLRSRTLVTRAGAWTAAIALWALILEAAGRGSILFSILAIALVALLVRRQAHGWTQRAAIVIGSGTTLWFVVTRALNYVYEKAAATSPGIERAIARGGSDNLRYSFWREAADMVAAHPWLGVGPEHYAYYQRAYTAAHPHSAPLQFAAEWGIPVALVVVTLVGWGLVSWLRRWRETVLNEPQASLVSALTASTLAAGGLALVDGVTMAPASQVMLAIVIGWMLALYYGRRPESRSNASPGRGTHAALGLVAVILAGVLVWSAGPYLFSPHQTLLAELEHLQPDKITPRFWLQGRLFDE